ncbi:hypothetical protein [Acidithiobacillus ferrooxidans]|uniref:hypothetical protein n=1 Tax=Acidithiobacillus ferrooxidans TaxID=920 RepID=UPI000A9B4133|nr:hypothetical protein [Acidithiobacillus ferrooxidans]MCR1341777.1 hypothetical protein [Acidithiobacillus ferrooxidans]QLK41886.1 hypothetical protein FE661_06755 [Acidithiobacillus ferrooxidans]QZT53848.1 hypothetical protein K7B00_06740 [Acidithiobacillus ferrooxidans]
MDGNSQGLFSRIWHVLQDRAVRITKIVQFDIEVLPHPRHSQAIFTNYPYFTVFLAFFVGFGRIDPYLDVGAHLKLTTCAR